MKNRDKFFIVFHFNMMVKNQHICMILNNILFKIFIQREAGVIISILTIILKVKERYFEFFTINFFLSITFIFIYFTVCHICGSAVNSPANAEDLGSIPS